MAAQWPPMLPHTVRNPHRCGSSCCCPTPHDSPSPAPRSVHKSLERATSDRVLDAMLGRTERCFRDPTPEELDALTLEGMRQAVSKLLTSGRRRARVCGGRGDFAKMVGKSVQDAWGAALLAGSDAGACAGR